MNRKRLIHIFLIAALAFLVYSNSFKNDFVFDDIKVIEENTFIRDLKNLPILLKPREYTERSRENRGYSPVSTLSYFLSYSLWGLKVEGYHITNTLFHSFNALLLYFIVLLALKDEKIAFFSSLLFACHPVHTEAVTWIVERRDVFSGFFFLTAFLLYIRSSLAGGGRKTYLYALSLFAFALSLFAKEMSITLPLVIVLYDRCFAEKEKRKNLYPAYFLIALLYLAGRLFIYRWGGGDVDSYSGGPFLNRMLNMTRGIIFYIRMLLFPSGLAVNHEFRLSKSLLEPAVLVSICIDAVIAAALVKLYKHSREIFFSVLFLFITLLPVSNMIPIPDVIVAERHLYIPSAGFCVFLGILAGRMYGRYDRRFAAPVFLLVLTMYSLITLKRNAEWKDDVTLWSKTLKLYPLSSTAYYNRGVAFRRAGDYNRAMDDYMKAIEINPHFSKTYYNRGNLYAENGHIDEALSDFDKAIKLNPQYSEAYANRGVLYWGKGFHDKAIADFTKALEINPQNKEAYDNRAKALGQGIRRQK